LEEIRLLTNLAKDGQPLVRVALAGGRILEERFTNPKLDSFSQRLGARCYLEALNRTETQQYIQSQINAVGGQGDAIFPEATCESVFQATGGVPRLINQVCDHAMLLGYVAGRNSVEPANIEESWADLQQLPTPWNAQAKNDPAADGVIEFGSLEDGDASDGSAGSAKTTAPLAKLLRVTQAEDEFDGDEAESECQIHRIERLLAKADENDFQPAGLIGPEVVLCFEEESHPFQETFEHEEVVADRYAARSGQQKPDARHGEIKTSSVPKSHRPFHPHSQSSVPSEDFASSSKTTRNMLGDAGNVELWEGREETAANVEEEAACEAVAVSVGADKDILIDSSSQAAPNRPTPPKRKEYRHLFAQLRRG
jgi:hypothetical protein